MMTTIMIITPLIENHHHCHNKTAVASWEARDKGLSLAFRFKYSGAACDDPLFASTLRITIIIIVSVVTIIIITIIAIEVI